MNGTNAQSNTKNISSGYSEFLLPDGEHIYPHYKDSLFASMCVCPYKDIKLPKLPCVFLCFVEFPVVFFPNLEMNDDKYVDLASIFFITMKILALLCCTRDSHLSTIQKTYRKQGYYKKESFTEIMQLVGFSFSLLRSRY